MAHIQLGHGLIPELDGGLGGQSPGQTHPVAFPAGKARDGALRELGEVQFRHGLGHARQIFAPGVAALGYDLAHGEGELELRLLAHPGQPPPPLHHEDARQWLSIPLDGPARRKQPRQRLDQGGLARPVRTHHRHEFARPELQRHRLQAAGHREAGGVEGGDHRGLRNSHRKKGPPMSDVTTPSLKPRGKVRVTRSQTSRKEAPPSME